MVVWPCSSTSTPLRVSSLRHPGDDLVQYRQQRLIGWRGHFDADRFAFRVALVHAVQHQAVQVNVEIGGRSKALDQRAGSAGGLVGFDLGLIEQEARDGPACDLQHRRHQLGLRGRQQTQRDRQPNLANPYPLAQRHVRDDVVEQMGRRLGHAPGPARLAEAASDTRSTSRRCPTLVGWCRRAKL